jgi:hypothetical protein
MPSQGFFKPHAMRAVIEFGHITNWLSLQQIKLSGPCQQRFLVIKGHHNLKTQEKICLFSGDLLLGCVCYQRMSFYRPLRR